MNTGFGIWDSGFDRTACGGPVLQVSNSNSCYRRKFHTESRFVGSGMGLLQIPNPESRIPEFKA